MQRGASAALAALAVALSIGADALAQSHKNASAGPPNALQGFASNRDQPVRIQAASLEVRDKDKIATFSGDVVVINGDTEMRCASLVVFYDEGGSAGGTMKAADPGPGGQQQIKRIEAAGGVTVTQKDQMASGDHATFNMRENTVMLSGNVIVTRAQDVLRGQHLTVNLTTGISKIDGGRVDAFIETRKPPEKK